MEEKKLTCIMCPIGCSLTVKKKADGTVEVFGNSCPRGEAYGKQEIIEPKRIITTITKYKTGTISLKTSKEVKKELYFDILKEINAKKPKNEYKIGDVFIKNILNTDADIIVTGIHIEK